MMISIRCFLCPAHVKQYFREVSREAAWSDSAFYGRQFTMRFPLTGAFQLIHHASTAEAGAVRTMRYTPRSPDAARVWQQAVRNELFEHLRLAELVQSRESIPFEARVTKTEKRDGFVLKDIQLRSTRGRLITVALAEPGRIEHALPAVVCVHGHGGNRFTPFDPGAREYKLCGTKLVRNGFVVISADIGQHEVYEKGRALMGERLWDLMRCVSYLETLPAVDAKRIGCAGLSLGGEMAMWLAAMDERIEATVSAGFLTLMDQMEQNHCMCWKFDGLRQLVDFPDIYSLVAPRPLQCQNGLKEDSTQFTVPLARKAMEQIHVIYRDFGVVQNAVLEVHDGGHEIALEPLLTFLSERLAK